MLGRSLKMAFWIFHDHLGALLIANLIWATAVAIPIGIALPPLFAGDLELGIVLGIPAVYLSLFLLNPVLGVGIAHMIKTAIDTRDAGIGDFFAGVRLYGFRAAALGLCYAIAALALGTSAWFYAAKLQSTYPLIGYGISALAVWLLALVGLTAQFTLPALVQRKAGTFATLRLTALLVLANPGLCIGIAVQCLMITIVVAVLLPLFFAGYGAAFLCIPSAAYELLARKYAVGGLAASPVDDASDDYLNRGLKDLLFPWKQ
ncbi:MAG: hypothetical protein FJY92_00190 [Candidatus Hydrogenedentes bacterium]|nr:hypothetical protein [Candidatus Hydrogenedentota bacterium]